MNTAECSQRPEGDRGGGTSLGGAFGGSEGNMPSGISGGGCGSSGSCGRQPASQWRRLQHRATQRAQAARRAAPRQRARRGTRLLLQGRAVARRVALHLRRSVARGQRRGRRQHAGHCGSASLVSQARRVRSLQSGALRKSRHGYTRAGTVQRTLQLRRGMSPRPATGQRARCCALASRGQRPSPFRRSTPRGRGGDASKASTHEGARAARTHRGRSPPAAPAELATDTPWWTPSSLLYLHARII
jgi:hypothetical protein